MANRVEVSFSTTTYEERLIVFIDLVGFKNFILGNSGNAEVVKELTTLFQNKVSEGFKNSEEDDNGYCESYAPALAFFSDSIILSFPLNMFKEREGSLFQKYAYINGYPFEVDMEKNRLLYFALNLVIEIQGHALKHGLLTRGCMTIGDVYHNRETWFGQGLIEAYEHESKIAIYPRVILTKKAFGYFEHEVLSNKCDAWFKDEDGFYVVNYIKFCLGRLGDSIGDGHHALKQMIESNLNKFSGVGNKEIYKKWIWFALKFNRVTDQSLRDKHGDALADNIQV